MWSKIVSLYKKSMPLLMFILALATAVIGWEQYKLSKNQKLFDIKKAHLERCYESVKDINKDISDLAQEGRKILRISLDLKEKAKNQKSIFPIPNELKTSLKDFYSKWDSVNTKVNSNQQNLSSALLNQYQKLAYSVAFARDEKRPDPWKHNYKLVLSLESGKQAEVDTDDMGVLPYGYCFGTAQKIYDSEKYTPDFSSNNEFMLFLDNCSELGSYTFDTNMNALNGISNYLVELSLSEAMIGH